MSETEYEVDRATGETWHSNGWGGGYDLTRNLG